MSNPVRSAPKKWVAFCRMCGRVEVIQKTKPSSCKTINKVRASSERKCGLPLVRHGAPTNPPR